MSEPNPRGPIPPIYDGDLHEPHSPSSLIEDLGEDIDEIRQIASDLGARPYTYHSITVRWSGGEVGRGDAKVIKDVALVPTPKTENLGYMDRELLAAGTVERGDVVLSGISPRLTEDEIEQLFGVNDGQDASEETFIEQRIDQRDGKTKRRRFTLAKAPERRPTKLDWRVIIRKADAGRARDGSPAAERDKIWR